jgi:hypothetical protein
MTYTMPYGATQTQTDKMKEELKLKIDGAKTLEELHAVWELIKTAKLSEDKFLMAWYDFKYNIMGAI